MFKWIKRLFGSRCVWYVEGYEDESHLDYGGASMIGPFKNEKEAAEYGKRVYGEGLYNCDVMWKPDKLPVVKEELNDWDESWFKNERQKD